MRIDQRQTSPDSQCRKPLLERGDSLRAVVLDAIRGGKLTLREIAAEAGMSTATVCKWKREAGLPARKGGIPTCHPDRPVYAKGLCKVCYSANWYKAA